MAAIKKIKPNGLNVVSTFSGCGGSCLGYRMAGFKVLWANEFVPAAQESYRANNPKSILDCRDIKTVKPEEILAAIKMQPGDLDLFDGSPPCQAFSMSGTREKGWGKDGGQRNEDMFFEYVRLLGGLQPKVFVAENVASLAMGTAKGYFLQVLAGLKQCGYRVECRLLNAKWLGVPQSRTRAIFIGVRNDLGVAPVHPLPLPYQYTVREAVPSIGSLIHDTHGNPNYSEGDVTDRPSSPILTQPHHFSVDGPGGKRKLAISELKAICSFPEDFQLVGTYAQQWARCGNAVPPVMMAQIAKTLVKEVFSKMRATAKG